MSLTRRVAHNTIIQFAGKSISVALGVGVVALMTRHLGPEGYGYFTTITAYLQIFGILVDFGLTLTTVQFLSNPAYEMRRVLGTMLTLRLMTAVPFLIAAVAIGFFMPYAPIVHVGIAILAFEFFFITFIQVLTGLFQKLLKMEYVAIADVLGRAVLFVGTFLAVRGNGGLLIILFMIVLASLCTVICMGIFAYRLLPFTLTFDSALAKKMLITSWPLGVSIACNLIYLKGDTFILSLFRPPEEVGIYGAPFRMLETLVNVPFLLVGLVFPLLRTMWLTDRARFSRMLQKTFDALLTIALPLVFGTIVLATPLMVLIAGPAFATSGPLLRILIVATGLIFVGTLFGHIVLIIEKQKPMILGYGATAAVALVGYLFFIPVYGAIAAAWITVIAEGMIVMITMAVTRVVTKVSFSFARVGKILIASGIMALTLFLLPPLHVLLLVTIGIAVYAGVLLLLRGVPHDILKEIFS